MTTPVIEPKTEYMQYAWLSLVALLGSIARAGKWVDANGKFMYPQLITELAASIVFGVIAAAIGAYFSWKPEIVGGISGCMGLIGAAGVTGIIKSLISIRLGGKKDASGPAAS